MDKTTYIENIPFIELGGQVYNSSQTALISSFDTDLTFNPDSDYVEYHIYNGNKTLVDSIDSLSSYNIYDNQVYINPESDLESRTPQSGQYYTLYNFLTPALSSSIQETYYISQISSNRTELRLSTTDILASDVAQSVNSLKELIETSPYYQDFYLNFGSNILILANNILLDDSDSTNPTVLIKLYEPLPDNLNINSQCWAVQKIAESRAYLINVQVTFDLQDPLIKIAGPNLNLKVKGQQNKTTQPVSTADLKNTNSKTLLYQLNSALNVPSVELNIDYTDFSNFVFFSSARTRLENFYYKLGLIEEYTYSGSISSESSSYYNSGSSGYWDGKIDEVITNFDGFEYALYYDSGSTTWPKSNNTPPYINVPTTSSEGLNWFESRLEVADTYDSNNKDLLVKSIPLYIQEDTANSNYELFVEMAGQLYDEVWLYTQAVTEKYNNTNGVNQGISKDLIGQTLRDFGIKLYQNNFTSDDLYSTYLGITPSGSLLPNTGQELIETYVTASATGSLIPIDDLSSEVYKRLYHNLPLLLKKKGTAAGLRTLLNVYGIPDTILRINEFGGKDKNPNTWDYWQNEYDYALNTQGTTFITSSFSVNTAWGATDNVPGAVEFRFKTPGIPLTANYSQSLWSTDKNIALRLKYVGSGLTSGSYEGSVVNPYYQYGRLEFFPDSTDLNSSASLYLPFFDGGWWSVLVDKNADNSYTVYSGNSLYDGKDGNTLGFTDSDSVTKLGNWSGSIEAYFGSSSLDATLFSGSLQEIRYYKNAISRSVFNDYIMNPNSIEGNGINSTPDQLIFRASLGGELYTGSTSIHPKVSGEWTTTSSFSSDSSFYFNNTPVYNSNKQISFYDQPASGIKNAVSNKIKLQNNTLYGTTLSNLTSLQQNYPTSQSFTRDINYLEVGYSPQNEINEDIMDSIGYFNLGDYIGDPRQISSSAFTYPALEQLKGDYFKKYNKSYNYQDYFRLIKFYDNSLFKLIKDFIPARTSAATGAIVKQHLLERNRQRPAQLTWTRPEYSGSVLSVARDYESGSIGVFEGGPAGAINDWINVDQSYTASILGPAGLVTYVESSEREFYNGSYSGSNIECQLSYSLNTAPLLNNVSSSRLSIKYEDVDYNSNALNPVNLPFIQSGSAYKAPVQDSNYDPNSAFFETRFAGTKNTGQYNFTELIASQSITADYPIDYFTNYFAYFDWVGGSNPQYPGGGNTHIVKLINAETKEIITLTDQNKNLETVAQIFKGGDSVYLIPFSASVYSSGFNTTVVEGGALYNTILTVTGSQSPFINCSTFEGSSQGFELYFNSSSLNILNDSGSEATNNTSWIYALSNPSSSIGTIEFFSFSDYQGVQFFNKNTGQYVYSGSSDWRINYTDTYLPLQYGDFIRFGTTGSGEGTSLDNSFNAGGLFQIADITTGSNMINTTSSINISPAIDQYTFTQNNALLSRDNQNFRIFRRIPNETFVLTNSIPYRGAGLLIPYNLNPKYSPQEIASELGL